jgi:hypothetical protein
VKDISDVCPRASNNNKQQRPSQLDRTGGSDMFESYSKTNISGSLLNVCEAHLCSLLLLDTVNNGNCATIEVQIVYVTVPPKKCQGAPMRTRPRLSVKVTAAPWVWAVIALPCLAWPNSCQLSLYHPDIDRQYFLYWFAVLPMPYVVPSTRTHVATTFLQEPAPSGVLLNRTRLTGGRYSRLFSIQYI